MNDEWLRFFLAAGLFLFLILATRQISDSNFGA